IHDLLPTTLLYTASLFKHWGINWISLSPDGQWLLTGSEDGTARLWSTANNQCQTHFQGHESYITFCHLENEVAFTCSADHTIRKWDVMTGRCLAIYRGHTSIVNRYKLRDVLEEEEMEEEIEEVEELSQDFLVTGSTDCTVKVWWVSTGRCHQTLLGHTGAVLCLILDAPNRELFSGSTDYTIRTWNIVTGEQLRVFKEHQGSIICLEVRKVAFFPKGVAAFVQLILLGREKYRRGSSFEEGREEKLGTQSWKRIFNKTSP
uniref:WD repeat domain 86 n=1 Tax=Pseudonaja textilis TaxID=8673 RepID=A0A670ZG39_PSETE